MHVLEKNLSYDTNYYLHEKRLIEMFSSSNTNTFYLSTFVMYGNNKTLALVFVNQFLTIISYTCFVPQKRLLCHNCLVYSRMCLKNRNKIKMNGKEAKLYAIWMGSFEFNASPRIKYIANITQMIPIRTYFLVLERNFSTSN